MNDSTMTDIVHDYIIIGTGAGGGTLAHCLAKTGKRILLLERGGYLPREADNWDPFAVLKHRRYLTTETWYDAKGDALHPSNGYWVGGNTKLYGAAMLRMRPEDFTEVKHKDGISPAWPISYAQFEPYYQQAEQLYQVRKHDDPDQLLPTFGHAPEIEAVAEKLRNQHQLNPFYLPLAIRYDDQHSERNACAQCNRCEGFPCMINAKADAHITCLQPLENSDNVRLLTGAKVDRLLTDPSGAVVTAMAATVNGEAHIFKGKIIIVACGAINSAALLLKSRNQTHPNGLANHSGMVGRNLMKHINGGVVCITGQEMLSLSVFHKTMALMDFYSGDDRYPYPMGTIQGLGKYNGSLLTLSGKDTQDEAFDQLVRQSISWWLTSEDLPDPNNRVKLDNNDNIVIEYRENNSSAFEQLNQRWLQLLPSVLPAKHYLSRKVPLSGLAHQCGSCRFGENPDNSVLDINCKAHDLDNLYVVDSSFFPSSAAVNPSLTIIANALRVGDHLASIH